MGFPLKLRKMVSTSHILNSLRIEMQTNPHEHPCCYVLSSICGSMRALQQSFKSSSLAWVY